MNNYNRLKNADILNLLITCLLGIPAFIVIIENLSFGWLQNLTLIGAILLLNALYIVRDGRNGYSLGKRLFGIQLVHENKKLTSKQRFKLFAKRNFELALTFAISVFSFRYVKELKQTNQRYKVQIVNTR